MISKVIVGAADIVRCYPHILTLFFGFWFRYCLHIELLAFSVVLVRCEFQISVIPIYVTSLECSIRSANSMGRCSSSLFRLFAEARCFS